MKDDTQLLDEVVVVAYGTSRKGDLTGAITSVRPDENEASKAISIDNLLQGKVAGLSMSVSSSTPVLPILLPFAVLTHCAEIISRCTLLIMYLKHLPVNLRNLLWEVVTSR